MIDGINRQADVPDENVGDMVSRQAAIDAIGNAYDRETLLNSFVRSIAIRAVRLLPSAQPEIIQCTQCMHYQQEHHYCELLETEFSPNDFCSYAERREDD